MGFSYYCSVHAINGTSFGKVAHCSETDLRHVLSPPQTRRF